MNSKLFLVLSVLFMTAPAAKADQVDAWLASYEEPKSLALKKIELRKNNKGEVKFRAYGTGYPDDVDWGEVTAQVFKESNGNSGAPNFLAKFSIPKATELLIISPNSGSGKPNSGGSAMVEMYTTFTDGRPPEYVKQWMRTPSK